MRPVLLNYLIIDRFPFIVGTYQYVISEEKLSWDDAQAECKKKGGELLAIKSRKEYAFVVEKLDAVSAELSSYWIYETEFVSKILNTCFALQFDVFENPTLLKDCALELPFICKVKGLYYTFWTILM